MAANASGLTLPGPMSIRVLHVEDDAFQQMSMSTVISAIRAKNPDCEIDLTQAGTGEEALNYCHKCEAFELVLLDYRLPDGTGETILPQIRKLVGTCAIVMLSGEEQEESMQRCWLDLGADTYRVKPVAAPVVVDLFAYALQKKTFLHKRRRVAPAGIMDIVGQTKSMTVGGPSGSSSSSTTSAPPGAAAGTLQPSSSAPPPQGGLSMPASGGTLSACPTSLSMGPPTPAASSFSGRARCHDDEFFRAAQSRPRAACAFASAATAGGAVTIPPSGRAADAPRLRCGGEQQ